MDEKQKRVLAGMVAMLTALEETDGWMPRSMLYVAMGADLRASELAIEVAQRAGYVESNSMTVTITAEGRRKAQEINAVLKAASA